MVIACCLEMHLFSSLYMLSVVVLGILAWGPNYGIHKSVYINSKHIHIQLD